ncbi:MAG TPA: acyl carrier protein [Usitatibacter sp.]|nr:acyl carrier protein [Usitatibacter sp.]
MYAQEIRNIVAAHGRLLTGVEKLGDESDLYEAGLTSLSTVNLMLALEEHFEVEFLDRMLGRKTFQSIANLSDAITELRGISPTPAAQSGFSDLRGAE